MAMTWGPFTFNMNPTSYSVPAIKKTTQKFTIMGTNVITSSLYNDNEMVLTWQGVTDDMNSIVTQLSNIIEYARFLNQTNNGSLFFNDGINIFSGYVTLRNASAIADGHQGTDRYNISLTFMLSTPL